MEHVFLFLKKVESLQMVLRKKENVFQALEEGMEEFFQALVMLMFFQTLEKVSMSFQALK